MYKLIAVVLCIAILLTAILVSGCMNKADVIKALADDPASACINVSTMYGSFAFGRAVLPGTKVNVSSGSCSLESNE